MAAERKLMEANQRLNSGRQSASLANSTEQDKAAERECCRSDATSSIYSLSNTTSGINNGFHQEPVVEPGHIKTNSKLYENGYSHARSESKPSFKGMQANNDYLSSFVTRYNPYCTGSMFNVDGKFIAPKSNISAAGPTASVRLRHPNPTKTSSTVDARVPLNSKSFLSAPSSSFSKHPFQSQHFNSTNKVQELESDFMSMLYRGSYPVKNFSSPSNQIQGLFTKGPSNYMPTGQTWGGYDGYKMGKNSNRSYNIEALKESTRGPRWRRVHTLLNSSDEMEQFGPRVRRDRYNRSDFQITYDNAKFFIIKSYSEDDVHKSIKYDVWSSTPNGNKKLNAAFHDAVTSHSEKGTRCPIFLFFSVNGSGQFLGLAEMIGPVDFEKTMDFWQQDKWSGFFPVTWHIVKDIPNTRLRHIILENNDNKPVTYTRDTQEAGLKQGLEMLSIFKSYSAVTSMLDDYRFYEEQEKLPQFRKKSKDDSLEYDNYRTDHLVKNLKVGPRKAEQVLTGARDMSDSYTSLAALARNLSLDDKSSSTVENFRKV